MTENAVLLDVESAGASGDMFLAALLHLLGDQEALMRVAASLLIYDPTVRVKVNEVSADGSKGFRVEIQADKGVRLSPGSLREVIKGVAEEIELSDTATRFANRVLDCLLEAESKAHDTPIDDLHLHETGSIDTVLDIVGTAYLLEQLGLLGKFRFLSTPVAVGSGTIDTEHGELEVPVPAVAEILVTNDVPYVTGEAKTETLTPTGAAILVTLVDEFVDSTEGFEVVRQGVGFGSRDLGGIPNMMRVLIGNRTAPVAAGAAKKTARPKAAPSARTRPASKAPAQKQDIGSWESDQVVVIETTVDDVDGEAIGTIFDTLLSDGDAYDVVMIPAYGKKNRPCYIVKVLSPESSLLTVADVLTRHLGSLGVRYATWDRLKAAREIIVCRLEIEGKEYMVRVKVSRSPDGGIINIKPEADDLMKVSAETGIPVRELKPRVALQAYAVTD